MSPLNQTIEFSYEIINSGTGAVVTSPANTSLYVVRPGKTSAEEVLDFQSISIDGGVFKTIIPKDYVDSVGILVAFVVADEGLSRDIFVAQVGSGMPDSKSVQVPFISRSQKNIPVLLPSTFDFGVELLSLFNRTVNTADTVQLLDAASNPLPIYFVEVMEEELEGPGTLTYTVVESSIRDYRQELSVVSEVLIDLLIRTDPMIPGGSIEIMKDGKPYISGTTNSQGELFVTVPKGEYTLRISKSSLTFSNNNIELVIDETLNNFYLWDTTFTEVEASPDGFCKIKARLVDVTGSPVKDTKFIFSPKLGLSGTGAGVLKNGLVSRTDANGEAEVNLVIGMTIKVNVEGTRVYEEFVVPDQAEANLFDLISFEDKGFEFHINEFPDSIRRTLVP